jgi:hypothetical protein
LVFTLILCWSCSISWRLPNCTTVFKNSFASLINLSWGSCDDNGGGGNGGGGDDCIVAVVGESMTKKRIENKSKNKNEKMRLLDYFSIYTVGM